VLSSPSSRPRLRQSSFWLGIFIVITSFCFLSSCARFEPRPLSPSRGVDELDSRSLTNSLLRQYFEQALKREVQPWPPAAWDLEKLCLAAYWYHPTLEVARAQWAASRAGELTAGQRPNPTLNVTPGYNATTATPSPWLPLAYLDFPIETAGKRKHRRARAAQLLEAARLNIIVLAWQVRRDVRAALLDYSAAERRSRLLTSQNRVQSEVLTALEAQAKAGAVGPAEVLPYRLAAAKVQVELHAAARLRTEARARLAEAVGVPIHALDGLNLEFDWSNPQRSEAALDSRELRRAALLGRPDVLGMLAEYAAAESALRLEIAKQYPDVRLQPGYQYDQGESKWTLGLNVELPVLSQNQGPIAEANARRNEIAARFNALQVKIMTEIDRSLALLKEDVAALSLLDSVTVSQTQRQESLQAQFKAGAVDRLEVLAAQSESLAAQVAELDAQARVQQSIGAVEDALQRPLILPETLLEGAAHNAP
jgi:outer membrane protein, heavy metal efflux system